MPYFVSSFSREFLLFFLCHIIGDIGLQLQSRNDPSAAVLEASERKNALKRLEDEMRTMNSPNYVMQMLDVEG